MDADDDEVLDGAHRAQRAAGVVHLPVPAEERVLREKEILAVLHERDGERRERVLVVARGQIDAQLMRAAEDARGKLDQGENWPCSGLRKNGYMRRLIVLAHRAACWRPPTRGACRSGLGTA